MAWREALRRKAPPQAPITKPKTFPAPVRGWVRNENLAASGPQGAFILDNWFATSTGIRVRKGSAKHATAGNGASITAIIPYVNGVADKLFAANATAIYDVTSPADVAVSPAAAVSGFTSDAWAFTPFTNSAGTFMVLVNGADPVQEFDGAAWSVPSITPAAGSFTSFTHVWSFKHRLFFIETDTFNAWYLALNAISGTATVFPLGGIFKLGGKLLFGASWSYDAGNGLNEACLFVTTEGEVAVYEGSDPAVDFSLKGVYRIGRPLGKTGHFRAGGDLAIATDIGLVPISQAITMDPAAIGAKAISYPIEEEWRLEAARRASPYPWSVEMWPTKQIALVSMASYAGFPKTCFAVNIRTGAWSRITGWDTRCLGLFGARMFFGTATGTVMEADVGGSDNGQLYTANFVGLFDQLGAPARIKTVSLARATFLSSLAPNSRLSISTNYRANLRNGPDAARPWNDTGFWNDGLWNVSRWSDGDIKRWEAKWRSVTGAGYAIAPNVQISSGSTIAPDIDLVQFDIVYETGDIVV